ncbi:MAG: DUF6751 family protein [Ruminococcus sp.]
MFTNCDGCTVYHKAADENLLPVWKRRVIENIYWEETHGQTSREKGMERSSDVLICISASSIGDYVPQKDDIIVKGITDADYSSLKLNEKHTVMTVTDFRFGSPAVQHIEVDAI